MLDGLVISMTRTHKTIVLSFLAALVAAAAVAGLSLGGKFGSSEAHAAKAQPVVIPTINSIDEVANAASPAAAFRSILGDSGIAQGLSPDTPVTKLFDIPLGSAYGGHSVWIAGSAGGRQCVKAFDGATCGTLSTNMPIAAFTLSHPTSALPGLIVGWNIPQVVAVSIDCPSGPVAATLVDGKGFFAIVPDAEVMQCNGTTATLADGTKLAL